MLMLRVVATVEIIDVVSMNSTTYFIEWLIMIIFRADIWWIAALTSKELSVRDE